MSSKETVMEQQKFYRVVTIEVDQTSEFGYEWETTLSVHATKDSAMRAKEYAEKEHDTCSDYIILKSVKVEAVPLVI